MKKSRLYGLIESGMMHTAFSTSDPMNFLYQRTLPITSRYKPDFSRKTRIETFVINEADMELVYINIYEL